MRAAVIEDGIVVNHIEIESLSYFDDLPKEQQPAKLPHLVAAGNSKKGDLWDGKVFTRPPGWMDKENEIKEKERIERESKDDVSNDALIETLRAKSTAEIESYVSILFSNLAKMDSEEIDDYITNNITDLAGAKMAISTIAKDMAETMRILKIVTKIAVYTIKKVGI